MKTKRSIPFRPREQPRPLKTYVARIPHATAIARTWLAADVRFCRLCPRCGAGPSGAPEVMLCLVQTSAPVEAEEARLFSLCE